MKHRYVKILGYIEGASLLALLFIAMPMKYMFHEPWLTRPLGSAHGLLFVVYVMALISTDLGLTKKQVALGVVLSCVPFGPFIFNHQHPKL